MNPQLFVGFSVMPIGVLFTNGGKRKLGTEVPGTFAPLQKKAV